MQGEDFIPARFSPAAAGGDGTPPLQGETALAVILPLLLL